MLLVCQLTSRFSKGLDILDLVSSGVLTYVSYFRFLPCPRALEYIGIAKAHYLPQTFSIPRAPLIGYFSDEDDLHDLRGHVEISDSGFGRLHE